MIIVSQDKTDVINFNNISWLYVVPNDNSIYVALEGTDINLGTYKTLKRAKEVLQEIITTFSYIQLSGTYEKARLQMEIMKLGRYEMPKE